MVVLTMVLMVRGCGDDMADKQSRSEPAGPRQSIAVQAPASRWPSAPQTSPQQPPGYGYLSQQPRQRQPVYFGNDGGNPWAVQSQPRAYGRSGYQQWGQTPPQGVQTPHDYTPVGPRFRPLESDTEQQVPPPVPAPPPAQRYYPVAPYDRLSGSSFGTPTYPYGGGYSGFGTPTYPYGGGYGGSYPGYYGPDAYGAPGGFYVPGWGGMPGPGWPGRW